MTELISGIQQVGIGVPNANEVWAWYRKVLGLNVPIFNDEADAKLMTRYTSGEVRRRHAIMTVSMAGGGGAEIWQYKNRVPLPPTFEPQLGDLGIFALKIKCLDVATFYAQSTHLQISKLEKTPENKPYFWLNDCHQNRLQIVEDNSWFKPNGHLTGGICGVVIGVSNIEKALKLYADTLQIDEIVYDKTGVFEDLTFLNAHQQRFRRVLLRKKMGKMGAFSQLLGNVEIELVQALDRAPRQIFENRDWGDAGFIHLCFDAIDMDQLKTKCEANGFLFTVDSANTFDMGEAAGRFSYIEDPDGTLIEFVETHKVPILKKLGLFLNIKNRKSQKPLPNWMVSTLGWSKVKD
ncbi:MAG: VOC family protein [Runella slithyformis]|nr:MAG: VOC family protein [Runella slithyformis]TAF93299.1 MAG: VOC family protein [Runella sp.]TAG24015.1 MAG: VOC family protein [Cytophagales bacterium]TAG34664.1 MAG: VOC family protein [Cytophagia bacterium]TAF26167.1 MAG: VOC family protein [Runella slithyformis]